jgi:hypothetical protein
MDNWDVFKNNLNTANTSSGTLDKQAQIYAESWEAARDRVTAAGEHIYSSLFDDEFFIDLTDGFGAIIEDIGKFIDSIGGLNGVLTTLGLIITKVFS